MRFQLSSWWVPKQIGENPRTLALLLLALAAFVIWVLARVWLRSETVHMSIAGFFQISDAGGYYDCSRWILDQGRYGSEWCDRRPIYPALLASLSALTGRLWLLTLLTQAVLVAFCIFALVRSSARHFGLAAALASLYLMHVFARENALLLSMTENGGLIFGALGLAFLLDGAARNGGLVLFVGAGLFSIALATRSGPLFALPALVVWAVLRYRVNLRQDWKMIALIAAGTTMGPALHFVVIGITSGNIENAQSNFAYTLYGLAVGNRTWSAVLTDYPHLIALNDAAAAREIYALAIRAILDKPALLMGALSDNFDRFLREPLFEIPGGRAWSLPNVFWWIGVVALVARRKNPVYSLLGWLNVGAALSAPIIIHDGGARVFAAGFGAQALQAGVGLSFALEAIMRNARIFDAGHSVLAGPGRFEAGLACLALFLVVMPLTPVRKILPKPSAPDFSCDPGLRSVVVRPGYETHHLAVAAEANRWDVLRMRVLAARFNHRIPDSEWSKNSFVSLPKPITLFRSWPVNKGRATGEVRFFFPQDASGFSYQMIHACIDETDNIAVAEASFARAVSVRRADPGK
jgi:hypothetical protein